MNISYINDTDFKLFINDNFFEEIEYESKEELMTLLKAVILKVKKNYGIIVSGLYEVNIYILKKIGLEFYFTKSDNYTFSNKVVDLKMTIHLDPNVYLKFDNYDYVSEYQNLRYEEGCFYLKPDLLDTSDLIKLSDLYTIIIDENNEIDNYLLLKKN